MDKKTRASKFRMDPESVVWYDPDGKIIGDGSLQAMLDWKKKHGQGKDPTKSPDNSKNKK